MTRPSFEFDYQHLEKTIYFPCNYRISFGFYDHHMCGPLMWIVVLYKDNKQVTELRVDSPVSGGEAFIHPDTLMMLTNAAMSVTQNSLTCWQIFACLQSLSGGDVWHVARNKIVEPYAISPHILEASFNPWFEEKIVVRPDSYPLLSGDVFKISSNCGRWMGEKYNKLGPDCLCDYPYDIDEINLFIETMQKYVDHSTTDVVFDI